MGLDSWSRGPVFLLGNAADCPSPATGMGTASGLPSAYYSSELQHAAFYGFLSGATVSLISPCIAHLSPTPGHIGTFLGMAMAVVSLAGLTGTLITGVLTDHYKSYMQAPIFSGASVLVGASLSFVTKLMMDKSLFF